jgi:hypothetical protein
VFIGVPNDTLKVTPELLLEAAAFQLSNAVFTQGCKAAEKREDRQTAPN